MLGILSAFRAYLRAVFADGIHKLYTIFDALAIAFYFLPGLDEWSRLNEGLRRSIGWAIILISFILANFSLYRKLALEETSLDESSLLVYPHEDSQCNAVRMLYAGSEIIRDLDIRMIYRDGDGKKQTKIVKEFFPKSDPYMAFEPYHYYHLEPNQVAYFPLLRKASVPNGKVTVSASFTGAKSGKLVQFERDFELQYQYLNPDARGPQLNPQTGFSIVRGILAMASNTNTDIDTLITFGKMALEQGWYDQELDYRPPYLDDKPVRLALSVDL